MYKRNYADIEIISSDAKLCAGDFQPKQLPAIIKKFISAIKYVRHHCLFGASNKYEDLQRTKKYIHYMHNRSRAGWFEKHSPCAVKYEGIYSPYQLAMVQWHFNPRGAHYDQTLPLLRRFSQQHPLADCTFALSTAQLKLLESAIVALNIRHGNCEVQANLVAKYLWENPQEIKRIETVAMRQFDHAFVIVNRQGQLSKPNSWGNDAWIIDPWYQAGIIYQAQYFITMIKCIQSYAKRQLLNYMNYTVMRHKWPNWSSIHAADVYSCELICKIKPQEQAYPTYSKDPFYPLEYYYTIDDLPIESKTPSHYHDGADKLLHQQQFKPCLDDIEQRVHPLTLNNK
jgi:hypothetical protein